jgi:hypothetical protein
LRVMSVFKMDSIRYCCGDDELQVQRLLVQLMGQYRNSMLWNGKHEN